MMPVAIALVDYASGFGTTPLVECGLKRPFGSPDYERAGEVSLQNIANQPPTQGGIGHHRPALSGEKGRIGAYRLATRRHERASEF